MIKTLYKKFQSWSEKGSVYIISDPHFGDEDMNWRWSLIKDYPYAVLDTLDEEYIAKCIAEYIVYKINKVVHKNDTLIVLGDVGDVSYVKKLRSGYKVLVKGNHDAGTENYLHNISTITKPLTLERSFKDFEHEWGHIDGPGDWASLTRKWNDYCKKCAKDQYSTEIYDFDCIIDFEYNDKYEENNPFKVAESWNVIIDTDNKLFDEIYEGPLFISEKILLSHEPVYGHWLNIHGHCHDFGLYPIKDELCMCCEQIDFTPISLQDIIKSGILKTINSVHRDTIDHATERKKLRG